MIRVLKVGKNFFSILAKQKPMTSRYRLASLWNQTEGQTLCGRVARCLSMTASGGCLLSGVQDKCSI